MPLNKVKLFLLVSLYLLWRHKDEGSGNWWEQHGTNSSAKDTGGFFFVFVLGDFLGFFFTINVVITKTDGLS